jgi:hypothetical protein
MEVTGRVENLHCTITRAIPKLWDVSNERETFDRLRRYFSRIGLEIEGADSKKILTVSMMAFQDCWTLDCDRLQRCRVHVVRPNGRVIPFCSYYLTSVDGKRLYGPSQEEPIPEVTDEEGRNRKLMIERYAKLAASNVAPTSCCGGNSPSQGGCCSSEAVPVEASSVDAGCGSPILLANPKATGVEKLAVVNAET